MIINLLCDSARKASKQSEKPAPGPASTLRDQFSRPAPVLNSQEERRSSAFEVGSVGFDERLLVLRDIVHGKNRI
jgi:hypothetical protein